MRQFGLSLLLASLPIATVAAPTCTQPNVMPSFAQPVTVSGLQPFIESAQLHGTARLVVTLPKDGGHPTSVSVKESSGYPAIDRNAVQNTLKMAFVPERRDCAPIGGQYLLSVVY